MRELLKVCQPQCAATLASALGSIQAQQHLKTRNACIPTPPHPPALCCPCHRVQSGTPPPGAAGAQSAAADGAHDAAPPHTCTATPNKATKCMMCTPHQTHCFLPSQKGAAHSAQFPHHTPSDREDQCEASSTAVSIIHVRNRPCGSVPNFCQVPFPSPIPPPLFLSPSFFPS